MKGVKMKQALSLTVIGICLAAILAGCASTEFEVTPGMERAAFKGKVLVFEKQMPAGVEYTVIGKFLQQKQWYGNTGETGNSALSTAAAKGANGILIERTGHRVTAWSWASPFTEGKLLWITNYDAALAAAGAK